MAAKAKKPGVVPGTRRVTTVEERVEEGTTGEELDLSPDDPTDEPGDDFLDVLGELAGGSEARCEIRRTSPSDFAGYCCTYALSEMSLDRLQSEWGGGKFSVRVRNAKGEFKGSTNVQIAGKPKNRDDAPAVVSQQPQPQAIDIGAIVTAATAGTKGQVEMLQGLVTALINKPEPAREKGPDTLAVIAALAPILKPEKGGGDNSADAVKLLMQGIELGKDLAGGGSGDTFTDLAMRGMDMVKTVAASQPAPRAPVRQIPAAHRAPPPQRLAAPEPGTVVAQEPPPNKVEVVNPESPPMLKLLGWIKQQAQLLVYQAKRGKNPELYAELFLDNIPEGVTLETIYEQMAADDAIDKLAQYTGNQEILAHRQWFEGFRSAVLDQLVDDGEEEQAAASAADRIEEAQPGEGGGDAGGGES